MTWMGTEWSPGRRWRTSLWRWVLYSAPTFINQYKLIKLQISRNTEAFIQNTITWNWLHNLDWTDMIDVMTLTTKTSVLNICGPVDIICMTLTRLWAVTSDDNISNLLETNQIKTDPNSAGLHGKLVIKYLDMEGDDRENYLLHGRVWMCDTLI